MKTLANRVAEVMHAFDESTQTINKFEIPSALKQLEAEDVEKNEQSLFIFMAEAMAFGFFETTDGNESRWGTHYGPMATMKNEQGQWVESPSIQLVTSEMISYWEARVRDVTNPILKARYADLVWDFSKKITGNSPDIFYAYTVIDSQLEIIDRKLYEYAVESINTIKRSMSIALSISDNARIEKVRDKMIELEDKIGKDSSPGLWGFCFEELLDNRNIPLTESQEKKIIGDIENRLERTTSDESFDAYAAESAAMLLAKYYRKWNRIDDYKRVLRKYGQAVIKTTESIEPLAGSAWVERLYSLYCEYGMKEDADKLTDLIMKLGEKSSRELKTFSSEISIPQEEIDKFVNALTEGDMDASLTRIAHYFLPNKEDVKQQVIDLANTAPLMSFIPFNILDWEGRTIAKIGPLETDLEGRIVNQMAQNMSINSIFLRVTIDKFISKFNPSSENLLAYFYRSPIFVESNKGIISIGIDSYLKGEHIIAAHVLIPQIEHAVRHLLKLLRGPFYKLGRGGALYLRNLDELLRDESIMFVLGEPITSYLRVLLTDQRGWNLRNDVCHNTIRTEKFSWTMTDRLFHVLLLLAQVRENNKENKED